MAHANGKVILLGEHAVVYGVPAIAAGIDRGATARATAAAVAVLNVNGRLVSASDGSEIGQAFQAVLECLKMGPHRVDVELELPAGAGLGASAAIGVVVARALLEASGAALDSARVLAAADRWERVFHGNPSGIDAAAAARAGCFSYTRGEGIVELSLGRELSLVVAISGPSASTKDMVEGVAELRRRRPELVDKALSGIAALVKNARICLEHGDLHGLGRLMDLNQMLLSGLFVSTEGIERACATARAAGALGAKLTGSGGGGAVIALAPGDVEPLLAAFRADGFECFATTVRAAAATGAA